VKLEKLTFRLRRDEDGYPPVDYESVWMKRLDETTGVIDNIPLFCRDAALGDTVTFRLVGDENQYVSTIERSGNSLLRALYYDSDALTLRRELEVLGCETELDTGHRLIAVSVPPAGRLNLVRAFLAGKEAAGELGYEEAILVEDAPR
jgi:hypothetical protein